MNWIKQNFLLIVVLFLAFFIRLVPILGNHFYFTIDQGRDAVAVRDILHGHLPLLGPQTSVEHIYHGVLWYYFLLIPYVLFGGSPFGAVFMMIMISIGTLYLTYQIGKKWQSGFALLVILSVFMPFYETSRYAFNPFFLPLVAILFIYALTKVNRKNAWPFYLSAAMVGLSFHADVMSFVPFVITFVFSTFYFLIKRKKTIEDIFLAMVIIGIFLIPHGISELTTGFSQWHTLTQYITSTNSIFSVSLPDQLKMLTTVFLKLIGKVTFPQLPIVGLVLFVASIIVAYIKTKKIDSFVLFSLLLLVVSFIWFFSNNGLRPWQTVYIGPILLISLIANISVLPKKLNTILLILLFIIQVSFSFFRISLYVQNTHDAGFLQNQLAVIDWIYKKAEGKAFSVYTYVPSVYDYHYQYLLYWQGKKKYGYVPCRYSTYPGTDASAYVTFSKEYQSPQEPCSNLQFFILEPAVTQSLQDEWHTGASDHTQLIEKTNVGDIQVEMRERDGP